MTYNIKEYINNPIKRFIFSKLMTNRSLSYSELKPQDSDNALFNYHLQHLVDLGLVLHKKDKYLLSNLGKKETSKIDWNGVYFEQFTNRVLLYLIVDGKVLYNKRSREPWTGDTTAISGKMYQGIGISEYAKERFLEKTGLNCDFNWIGTLRKIVRDKEKNLLNDMFYNICYATKYSGELCPQDKWNLEEKLIWYSLDDAIEIEKSNKSAEKVTLSILSNFKNNDFSSFCVEEYIFI